MKSNVIYIQDYIGKKTGSSATAEILEDQGLLTLVVENGNYSFACSVCGFIVSKDQSEPLESCQFCWSCFKDF